MVTLPMIPKGQKVCKGHASSMLMTYTEKYFKHLVLSIYETAKRNHESGLYFDLVNILLNRMMNAWVDTAEAMGTDATLIREMSIHDQEEYVRVYENRYPRWLRLGVL